MTWTVSWIVLCKEYRTIAEIPLDWCRGKNTKVTPERIVWQVGFKVSTKVGYGCLNITNRTRDNSPQMIWELCNQFHIITVVLVEEETFLRRPKCYEEGWKGYRITHPTFWMLKWCSYSEMFLWLHMFGVHWTQVSRHTVPFVGFSMSEEHYLKLIIRVLLVQIERS